MNAYLSREEKQNFVRATALVALIEKTIDGYAGAKSTDPAFLKYLRMGRSMVAKALAMRGDALEPEAKEEFAKQVSKLEFICVPRQQAKKEYSEMLALKTVFPMKVQDFEDWYCAVIETTCKTCHQDGYTDCGIRRILNEYGVYPIDPEAKNKCQYGYVGTLEAEELQLVAAETVSAEKYNQVVAELKVLEAKMKNAAEDFQRYEKEREALNSYSHDLEWQCDEWQRQVVDLQKQADEAAAAPEIELPGSDNGQLAVSLGMTNGNCLVYDLPEYMTQILVKELHQASRRNRGICASHVDGDLIAVDMSEVVVMRVANAPADMWTRTQHQEAPQRLQPEEAPTEYPEDTGERERYQVECKCGAEYFCTMNVGRTKARCRNCKATVFADRQAERVPDPMDSTAATLLTNRYWVEREALPSCDPALLGDNPTLAGQPPRELSQGSMYIGRDKRYSDPCNLLD